MTDFGKKIFFFYIQLSLKLNVIETNWFPLQKEEVNKIMFDIKRELMGYEYIKWGQLWRSSLPPSSMGVPSMGEKDIPVTICSTWSTGISNDSGSVSEAAFNKTLWIHTINHLHIGLTSSHFRPSVLFPLSLSWKQKISSLFSSTVALLEG